MDSELAGFFLCNLNYENVRDVWQVGHKVHICIAERNQTSENVISKFGYESRLLGVYEYLLIYRIQLADHSFISEIQK